MNAGRGPSRTPATAVLDTDDIRLDPAAVQAAAWKTALNACLATRTPFGAPFDAVGECRRFADGRARDDGDDAFQSHRRVFLPPGRPCDPPGGETVRAVAACEGKAFRRAMAAGDLVRSGVYAAARGAPAALGERCVPGAAVSASRHTRTLLAGTGLEPPVTVTDDGQAIVRLALPGKPDPALFPRAAGRPETRHHETAVVEGAPAGVRAGRRGGCGRDIAVDRNPDVHGSPALQREGADLVVADLLVMVHDVWGGQR